LKGLKSAGGVPNCTAGVTEFRDRSRGIGQQALLVGRIDPGLRYHPRAVARTDLMLVGIDQCIKSCRIDQPLLDQQRFERLDAKGEVRRNRMVAVNILFFLDEIVCVSFHIDQEFRFGIQRKMGEVYTPYLDVCRNFCGGRNRS
jgi:hypothetical protein